MAALVDGVLDEKSQNAIKNSKILVVGAGGIGCEVLKNLVLHGFEYIEVIDLDTIDISNLNRQFLFHKKDVGKPKSLVARESVLVYNPKANIIAHHDSITNTKFDVDFFKKFSVVANALDNLAARSHVNRMCLAADIPLIESGTAGYFGQVTVYKKRNTECYECFHRVGNKTYPSCTIRNTPSELIHCVVWAKHLFNQLFGEPDADEEVAPDLTDEELSENFEESKDANTAIRISTRDWAKACSYDPYKLFHKLFNEDIHYLLSMSGLWQRRKPPIPLDWDNLPDAVAGSSHEETHSLFRDQIIWSIKECADKFSKSLSALKNEVDKNGSDAILIWDKDDPNTMDFVTACANMRAYCFHIAPKSRFDIKSMAGNIIPAVASSNAIIAGIVVLQLVKILTDGIEKCKMVFLSHNFKITGKLIATSDLPPPNKKCMVCSPKIPEIPIKLNINTITIRTLDEKVLKEKLHMIAPDVIVIDGKGTILISSDPEDMEEIKDKTLNKMNIVNNTRLQCDDFFQHYKLMLLIINNSDLADQEFEIVYDLKLLKQGDVQEEDVEMNDNSNLPKNDEENVSDDVQILPVSLSLDDNGLQPPHKKFKI